MPWIATHELTPETLSAHQHQIYNALDVCVTLECFQEINRLQGNTPIPVVYDFARAMQAPALDMMLRGFKIDRMACEAGKADLRAKLARIETILNRYATAVWDKSLNPRSTKQLLDFFYNAMKLPEVTIYKKGVPKRSMDREVLEKLQAHFYAQPIIEAILAYRDNAKRLEVLETEIDPDGRMRTSYNIVGTETGRWSSSTSALGSGCVPGSCEVLTTSGWRRIDQFHDGEFAAQWDIRTGEVTFRPADLHVADGHDKMLVCSTEQVRQIVTLDHRVPHYNQYLTVAHTRAAREVAELSQCAIPLGGMYKAGTEEYPAFLAMLMADGSKEGTGWRISLFKERKINRFFQLAEKFGFKYTEQSCQRDGRRFYIPGYLHFPKKWGNWVLDLTLSTRIELIKEAAHWDAHARGNSYIFFTASREQADWFAIMAHLSGYATTTHRKEQSPGSYSDTIMYWVNVKPRNHARVMRKHWNLVPYSGKVYCLKTSTGYFLIRQDGLISVTGNTNLQNLSPDLRSIFVADPGFKICGIDLEQAESREVGWRCGILFDDWSYLDACESGDLHTAVCQIAWPELAWTGDLRKDKALAEEKFYRHLSRRDLAKKLGHGCLTVDHEVLTPSGWVPITSKPDYILQWSEDHSEFAPVSNWIDKEWTGNLHTWEGQSLSVRMTADHRVYYTTDQTIQPGAAERIPESAKIPLGGGQFASMRNVTRRVEHTTARVLCPTVPSGAFYTRRNGLISVTGNSNYYGQPPTMAKHAKIESKIAEQFQDTYFGRFVGIPKWHHWVAEQLQTTQRIVTPFGRERYFFGRPRDDTTLREAIAYDPQSSTGDRLNLGLYRIWRDLSPRVQLLAQVHDAVYFQYREDDDEAEIVTKALALLSTKLTAPNGRVFDVPGEVKTGFNWGSFHPVKNPDGLKKWQGHDMRKRTPLLERVL